MYAWGGCKFLIWGIIIHYSETRPLNPNLRNTQQARETSETGYGATTRYISLTSWDDEYIREEMRAGRCAEEDEVW